MKVRLFAQHLAWRAGTCLIVFAYVLCISFLGQMLLRIERDEAIWVRWAIGTAAITVGTALVHAWFARHAQTWKPTRHLIGGTIEIAARIMIVVLAVVFFPITIFVWLIRRGRIMTPEQRELWFHSTASFRR
jgi:hypothetical protein